MALLTNRNAEEVARTVGIAPRTLYRWLNDEDFDKAYRKARRDAYNQGTARLQQAHSAAVTTVVRTMVDPNVPASTRLRAADMVLERTSKAIELEEIEARLSELERAAEETKHRR